MSPRGLAASGHYDMVQVRHLFLGHYDMVLVRHDPGYTFIHVIVASGHYDMVLVRHGSDFFEFLLNVTTVWLKNYLNCLYHAEKR